MGAVISISLEAEPMRWLRWMRRSRTSATSAGKTSSMAQAEEGTLAAGVHHLAEGAVGEDDAALGVEGGDAVGDGFEHGLELAAAGFEGGVGRGELDGGVLDGAAAVFEVGGHVVEAADQLAEFFGGALSARGARSRPAAMASMASASASTGLVTCLERCSASQLEAKSARLVIISSSSM